MAVSGLRDDHGLSLSDKLELLEKKVRAVSVSDVDNLFSKDLVHNAPVLKVTKVSTSSAALCTIVKAYSPCENSVDPHYHPSDEYLVVTEGVVRIPELDAVLNHGDSILLRTGTIHSLEIEAKTELFLVFTPGLVKRNGREQHARRRWWQGLFGGHPTADAVIERSSL